MLDKRGGLAVTIAALATSTCIAGIDNLRMDVEALPVESKPSLQDMQSRPYISASKDWFIWCSSVVRSGDGKYHMFHSRWPKSIGFLSWLTHSEVVHAVSDRAEGPYRELGVAIPASGPERNGWFTAHNPKVKHFGDSYYIYFCQTRGDSFGEDSEQKRIEVARTGHGHPLWRKEARPNQRTFVAKSQSLDGPWDISDKPIIEPAKTITTLAVNPAICRRPDDGYLMIVKGDKPNEKRFIRNQALATAPAPEGPWTIQDRPAIDYVDTEDASIWYDQTRERYYAVFHTHGFIGMITSSDGIEWEKATQYRLTPKSIRFDDGSVWKPNRMERPFVLTDERGVPQFLFAACRKGGMSVIVALPLRVLN